MPALQLDDIQLSLNVKYSVIKLRIDSNFKVSACKPLTTGKYH